MLISLIKRYLPVIAMLSVIILVAFVDCEEFTP